MKTNPNDLRADKIMADFNAGKHKRSSKSKRSIKLNEIRLLKSQIKDANERIACLSKFSKIVDHGLLNSELVHDFLLDRHHINSPMAAIVWDTKFRVVQWNKSAELIFGYSEEQALGCHAKELIIPQTIQDEIVKNIFHSLLKAKDGGKSTNENVTADGTKILCEWYNTPIRNSDGHVVGVASLAQDITNQVTVEQTARDHKERFNRLVENAGDAFFVHDMHGKILDVNNAASQSTGYTKSELLCMSVSDIETTAHIEDLEDLCNQVDQGEVKLPLTVEGTNIRKDGSTFPVEIRLGMLSEGGQKLFISIVRDCTQRKQAENELKSRKLALRAFIDSMIDPAAMVDRNTKFTVVNKAMTKRFSSTSEDLIGKLMFAYPPTKVGLTRKHNIERVFSSGKPYRKTDEYNGHWFDNTYTPVFDLNSNVAQVAIVARDITDDVKKDLALKKMSQATDQSANLVFITDIKGTIEYVNRGFIEATGYSRDEAIGQTPRLISSGETPKEAYRELWETILSGRIWRGEFKNKRKDGSLFWATSTITPMLDDNGNITHFVTSHFDITSIKNAEQKLREREARYALVLNGVNDGIWEWDLKTDAISLSSRFIESLGYNANEFKLTSQTWASIVHPDDVEKRASRMHVYLRGAEPTCSCEYRVRAHSGKYVWLLERGVAMRTGNGKVVRMAGSISDVTKRRNTEDSLRQAQKMEAVGQMAGGIAHEFKNALVGVVGFTEMAMIDVTDTENVTLCLNELKKAADSASKLTNDLLAFSRNQEIIPTKIGFDISVLLLDMNTFLKPLLGSGVHFKLKSWKDPITVNADPSQLSQVILNFCMNARDAIEGRGDIVVGSRVIKIEQETTKFGINVYPNSYAQIYVSDTGIGIDETIIQNLFDPFFTTKPKGQGTGLGLSVAHGIVEKSGGFIDIESTVGIGTTFMVNLPISNDSEDELE